MNPERDVDFGDVARRRSLPALTPPIVLIVLAAIGSAIVARAGVGTNVPSFFIIVLGQLLSAGIWVGAVWLGGILVYRGIVQSRR